MEFLQLSYFQKVARSGNLTRTAKTLYISPAALSTTISRLEKELGVPLFDRNGNSIALNDSGRLFLHYVDRILSDADQAVKELQHRRSCELRLATTSPNVFSGLLTDFYNECPEAVVVNHTLHVDELPTIDLLNKWDYLLTSPDDMTFSSGGPGYECRVLYDDDMPVLLLPRDHPLASRESIDLKELIDEHFVALIPGFSSRYYFDHLCRQVGFTPKISVECEYMIRAKMVANHRGIAVATARSQALYREDHVAVVPIREPYYPRAQCLYWNAKRDFNSVALQFRDFAIRYYAKR